MPLDLHQSLTTSARGSRRHDRSRSLGSEGRDVDLLDIVAVAALEAQPVAGMLRFVDDHLSGDLFDRFGVRLRIDAILTANGLKPESSVRGGERASTAAMIKTLAPDAAWRLAANRATLALAKAVVGAGGDASESRVDSLPQFSALQQLSGIWDSDAGDVHRWTAPYDEAAIGAVVRALISLSRIDPVALATEAAAVIRLVEDEPDRTPFLSGVRAIDVPQPDWSGAGLLGLDRGSVLTAFRHGSQWLRHIAANLLACMPATHEEQLGLLASAAGAELFYASQIVRAADGEAWVDAALARAAAGPSDGVEHLFEALATLEIPPSLLRRGDRDRVVIGHPGCGRGGQPAGAKMDRPGRRHSEAGRRVRLPRHDRPPVAGHAVH